MGDILKSWKLFQTWIFFFFFLTPVSSRLLSGQGAMWLFCLEVVKIRQKIGFIFNLSSVKALHCALMGKLTCCLRPSLLEEIKGKKAAFSSLAASPGCWLQALWRRRWQQGCVSGLETSDWDKRVNVLNGGSGASFCMLIFDVCAAASILLFNGARRSN